jgi:hypothetical protein
MSGTKIGLRETEKDAVSIEKVGGREAEPESKRCTPTTQIMRLIERNGLRNIIRRTGRKSQSGPNNGGKTMWNTSAVFRQSTTERENNGTQRRERLRDNNIYRGGERCLKDQVILVPKTPKSVQRLVPSAQSQEIQKIVRELLESVSMR